MGTQFGRGKGRGEAVGYVQWWAAEWVWLSRVYNDERGGMWCRLPTPGAGG
jgi:hypothetical protein